MRHWTTRWAAPLRTLALLGCGLLAGSAFASPEGAGAKAPADARAWLTRIHNAANTANYQGTLVFSAGGVLSSSRVWHYGVGDQTFERREALDGRQQRVLRHNDAVHTVWPQDGKVLVERGGLHIGRSGTPSAVEPRALDHYELRREGPARIAGRDAEVFVLAPRDGLRYAQRLWADRETGLMLRADVLDAEQAVLESAAFSEIEIGVKPQPETVQRDIRRTSRDASLRTVYASRQPTDLDREGWTLSHPVAGFELAGCVKRPLVEPAGSAAAPEAGGPGPADDGGPQILQAVFFDGLTHVSLFIERYQSRRHRDQVQARLGATSTLTQRHDQHWITAMGDVPPDTLRQFIAALQRKR